MFSTNKYINFGNCDSLRQILTTHILLQLNGITHLFPTAVFPKQWSIDHHQSAKCNSVTCVQLLIKLTAISLVHESEKVENTALDSILNIRNINFTLRKMNIVTYFRQFKFDSWPILHSLHVIRVLGFKFLPCLRLALSEGSYIFC